MSKIHEALKKAQQQRLSTKPTDGQPIPQDFDPTRVLREELTNNGLRPDPGTSEPLRTKSSEELLQFEKFVAQCAKPAWKLDRDLVFFNEEASSSLGAEQFRTLRARLDKIRETKHIKKVQITSAISGEGKTFIATNLAQAIARQHGRRVLLIDGDLRRSMLHMPLSAPTTPGLSDYLLGDAVETDIVQHGKKGNLCLIAGGRQVSDPSELLSNGRLKQLIDRMTGIFDWILVDSPPVLPLADAAVISPVCDGVLVVVRAESTPLAFVRKTAQELKGRNILGVVLNAVAGQNYGAYYPYNHRYGSIASAETA